MNRFCNAAGVGLIPWAPLSRGHLARRPETFGNTARSTSEIQSGAFPEFATSEPNASIIKRVVELADKKGWPVSHVALAWVNKRVTSPIIGLSSVKRLAEAVAVTGKTLTEEEERYLEELYTPKEVSGHV
jgi:aryl-alcohol dehydrogenase-like predicted oxidoreductase